MAFDVSSQPPHLKRSIADESRHTWALESARLFVRFFVPNLYVENVPEDLYEALRSRAKSEGRSIGA